MADVVDIKSGMNRATRMYLERVVGQAFREGATEEAIVAWLSSQGMPEPGAFIARLSKRAKLPSLGALELKKLGGRAALRQVFGLPPESTVAQQARVLTPEDFVAYLPDHSYFCIPTREVWKQESIIGQVTSPVDDLNVCEWLDQHRHVEQLSWCPGRDLFVRNTIIADGGWIPRNGMTVFNMYRPPQELPGDPNQATRWVEHVHRIYPKDANHIIAWLAHRVQKPWEKINHGLVLGGSMRIGKDTILVPVRAAVGEWNVSDIGPEILMGRFNGYLKSILLRINESRDLGEMNRFAFYERCKSLLASPPEVFRVDEKNLREHPVPNIVGVIFTTNYKEGGMYLPPDDARHYVAWSDVLKEDLEPGYLEGLHHWYHHEGGNGHVAAFLKNPALLEHFDAKSPPPRTEAWYEMTTSSKSVEESEIADILDGLKNPDAVTLGDLIDYTLSSAESNLALAKFGEWLADRKNNRTIPHKLEACGYVAVRNVDDQRDGLWRINGKRQSVYVRRALPPNERLDAARHRAGRMTSKPSN